MTSGARTYLLNKYLLISVEVVFLNYSVYFALGACNCTKFVHFLLDQGITEYTSLVCNVTGTKYFVRKKKRNKVLRCTKPSSSHTNCTYTCSFS